MKFLFLISALVCQLVAIKEKNTIHAVRIEGMRFVPAVLEIKCGDKVQWINSSGRSHNVVANDKSFASEMMEGNNEVFEHCFNTTGGFSYYCRPHRSMGMKGRIIVN